MKKVLTLLLATGFLFACNTGSHDKKSIAADTSVQNHNEHEE